jgi:hypothetical protein
MQVQRSTPTCSHFETAELPCASCQGRMRLAVVEPSKPNLELRTYRCTLCGSLEAFLMEI